MARTVDPASHSVRREVFVDAAQRLIATRGYEEVSIQDILDATGASRGAFYHYFDSKVALLEAIVGRMIDGAFETFGSVVDDPGLDALTKFRALFRSIASFKAERRDFVVGLIQVWLSDENALFRERYRRTLLPRIQPVLAGIVRQGVAEGSMSATSPDDTAAVLVALLGGSADVATDLFVANHAGKASAAEVTCRLLAFDEAFARVLGLPPGSRPVFDEQTLREWFV